MGAAGIPPPAAPSGSSVAAPLQQEEQKLPPSVEAFQELIDGPLTKYITLSKELGGLIEQQVRCPFPSPPPRPLADPPRLPARPQSQQVANGFLAQKDFVQLAAACKKLSASDPQYQALIGPTQTALLAVIDVKEKNRASKESNQLTVVSEGIPALGWVTLVRLLSASLSWKLRRPAERARLALLQDAKPGPYVGEFKDSAMFWVNRVIKEHKESCVALVSSPPHLVSRRLTVPSLPLCSQEPQAGRMGPQLCRAPRGTAQVHHAAPHDGPDLEPQGTPRLLPSLPPLPRLAPPPN